jgi:site-specific recombinase XerD
VTRLRKLMLDELQRRNYAQNTVRAYIHAIEDFAKYFHRSPDRLGPEHIREYQVHLFRDCKLSAGTIEGRTAALRFLFVKTLRRPYLSRSHSVSQASAADAHSTESGGSGAAHRFRAEPDAPHHADDAVCDRPAAN